MRDDAQAGAPDALGFLALDKGAEPAMEPLVAAVSRRLRLPCRLLQGVPAPPAAPIDGRDQLDADALLETLEAMAPEVAAPGEVLVGVTSRDIGSVLFTHFFGRARQWGRAALVALARLGPEFYGLPADPVLARRRAEVEVLHEVGHVLGLGHCRMPECVMTFAATVDAIDRRSRHYCGRCEARLPEGIAAPVP